MVTTFETVPFDRKILSRCSWCRQKFEVSSAAVYLGTRVYQPLLAGEIGAYHLACAKEVEAATDWIVSCGEAETGGGIVMDEKPVIEVRDPMAQAPETGGVDGSGSWTVHPIIFDKAVIRPESAIRMQIDSYCNVMLTSSNEDGESCFMELDLEALGELGYLIVQAANLTEPDPI